MSNPINDSKPKINTEDYTTIPWKVYEKLAVTSEVREKRKDIIIGILIFLLFVSNALWLFFAYKYVSNIEIVDDYSTDIQAEQDGSGVNIVGGGDISYGTEGSDNSTPQKNSTT